MSKEFTLEHFDCSQIGPRSVIIVRCEDPCDVVPFRLPVKHPVSLIWMKPGESIETKSEEDMRGSGWVREK